jgi:hypothetical protein
VERGDSLVTADQVRDWCGHPFAQVTVEPVLDLDQQVRVAEYQVPDRIAEQADLRDRGCVCPVVQPPRPPLRPRPRHPYAAGGGPRPGTSARYAAGTTG